MARRCRLVLRSDPPGAPGVAGAIRHFGVALDLFERQMAGHRHDLVDRLALVEAGKHPARGYQLAARKRSA